MRVVVEVDRCESNGVCAALAPSLFALDDEEQLHVLVSRPEPSQWAAAEAAARSCPKAAISLID
ncbi:ferredoxin [Micromonospora sp. FIMYZ51]|uniref:ferredoxin n=1 Tax=Micromonospora sp. FIMYZ51 TaxID=3051832 RepID=UPI00311D5649